MTTTMQSNPIYYSLSSLASGHAAAQRTVDLHKRPEHNGFGLFLGEDMPSGLYVVTVEGNTPAADANIQPGDRILAVNGESVSSMSADPKAAIVKAASQSNRMTLTVESRNLMQTTQPSLSRSQNVLHAPPRPPRAPIHMQAERRSMDLESYLKSLFANENVQIIPSKLPTRKHEYVITSDTPEPTSAATHSLPSRHPPTDNNEKRPHSRHHHHQQHRRRRPREPKPPVLVTKETQTSPYEDDDDVFSPEPTQTPTYRQYPSQPSMGTSQRILRTNISASNGDSTELKTGATNPTARHTTNESSPSNDTNHQVAESSQTTKTHMVDVVAAAVAAKRVEEAKTREPAPVNYETVSKPAGGREQPTARDQASVREQPNPKPVNGRDQPTAREQANTGELAPSQDHQSPPPYSPNDPSSISVAPSEGAYNVADAERSREPASEPSAAAAAPVARISGVREVTLRRVPDFQGFGFHLQFNKIYYLVHRVEEGCPAKTAGLQANDVILKINQQTTERMPHSSFVQIVNASTQVTFTVQHLEEYLHDNPVPPRNPHAASAVSSAIAADGDKRKGGISKALSKISSR